uniref:Glutaredoxin-2, mitochondrial n=1 Tax=Phasianus colchicus TaxID=9054 RepID=A0A669Q3F6_PHACC
RVWVISRLPNSRLFISHLPACAWEPAVQGKACRKCRTAGFVSPRLTEEFRLMKIEVISDNCVVIFSKTTCFYCKMAKKLFEGLNVNYTAVELDVNKNGSQFQDILEQMTGGRTVPRVFVNGTFIGGATDTQRLHEEGKLLPLIHQCQVKTNSGTTI